MADSDDEQTSIVAAPEPIPYFLVTYPNADDQDRAIRAWVFEMIYGRDELKLDQSTLDYCEKAFQWIKSGPPSTVAQFTPRVAGERVV